MRLPRGCAGGYRRGGLLLLAIASIPAMATGTYLGHRLTLRLSREQFLRIVYLLLIGTGTTLILRAISSEMS